MVSLFLTNDKDVHRAVARNLVLNHLSRSQKILVVPVKVLHLMALVPNHYNIHYISKLLCDYLS